MSADWQIHPRDANLGRTYDPLSGWGELTLVERHNLPDTWTISGPASVLSVFAPGMGAILDRDGVQITSGQVKTISRTGEMVKGRPVENMTVSFASDMDLLAGRIIYPLRTHHLASTTSTFGAEYDRRNGPVEDLMLGYISASMGAGALSDRVQSRLITPLGQGRGGTTQVSARLDNLGVLVASMAEAGNLRVRVDHLENGGGAWLNMTVEQVADLSDDVRFGTADSTAAGLITAWEYELSAPTVTRAIIGGGGEAAAREFIEMRDTAAEALWVRAVESFVDQRQVDVDSTDKLAELTTAGQKELDAGKGPVKVSFTPMLGPDLEYRRDVRVGDIVGYDLPGLDPAEEKIREATTVVSRDSNEATERVSVVVGTPDAPQTRTQQQAARALRAITAIQRSQ